MARPKRLRSAVGVLKDKISLIKATLRLTSTRTASLHAAVLRATSHNPWDPPPTHTVEDVLSLTTHHIPTAIALVRALLQRVHHTSDAYVALKCLLTIHHLVSRGSHLIKEQIVSFTEVGPLFDLSTFRDQSDDDTWELSNWIRWYADVLDQKISIPEFKSNSLNTLINLLERISQSPNSLQYQKISLVYEVMKLIGEDYRVIIRQIYTKVEEFSTRIGDFTDDSSDKFLGDLKRIEKRKEKLLLMFLNKKKNDGFWELIENVTKDVELEKERRAVMKMVTFNRVESEPSTHRSSNRVDESKSLVVVPAPRVKKWLDVDWNRPLVVSSTA